MASAKIETNIIFPPVAESWYQLIGRNNSWRVHKRAAKAVNFLSSLEMGGAESLSEISVFKHDEHGYLAEAYNRLADFLLFAEENARLVLYLPFSWLPDKAWHTESENLRLAIRRFLNAYMFSWRRSLSDIDFRVDFSDGDLVESANPVTDNALVAKAAHLLPVLFSKGLINKEEVWHLIADSKYPVTVESLQSGLVASEKLSLITDAAKIDLSAKSVIPESKSFSEILEEVAQEIALGYEQLSDRRFDVSAKRLIWEKEIVVDRALARQTESLRALSNPKVPVVYLRDERLRDAWHKLRLHLSALDIFSQANWPFVEPLARLSTSFSTTNLEADFLAQIQQTALAITYDAKLSHLLYPVILLYGSRVKGYAVSRADVDLAIFIREEVDFSQRATIKKLLSENLPFFSKDGDPLEFWLQASGNQLVVRSQDGNKLLASNDSIHVLFGSAWCGQLEAVEFLQDKMLPYYFSASQNASKRKFWLKVLERDFLQYRLLHKGYHHFFPAAGKIRLSGITEIDSNCAFWDEGYRQLASELFVRKVFLPKV